MELVRLSGVAYKENPAYGWRMEMVHLISGREKCMNCILIDIVYDRAEST